MFTVCPKCALTLVVTTADLRIAQGYVRCGRCSNVFNALNALSDERNAGTEVDQATATQSRPSLPEADAELPAKSLEFDPVATNVSEIFVEPSPEDAKATGSFEAIVLEGGEAPEKIADPDAELHRELKSLAERIDEQQRRPPTNTGAMQAAETLRELESSLGDAADDDDEPLDARSARWWRAGVAALILTLILQAVHHYRHDLAVIPQLNGVLSKIYDAIGVSLEPRWDVARYDVRQLGAMSDPEDSDRLIVRASIKNEATRPQPLPLLRVAVQDRFGNRIASRDVAPESYLSSVTAQRVQLASGERIDVEMRFIDPGESAVGFEIDACLTAPGGRVNCANR